MTNDLIRLVVDLGIVAAATCFILVRLLMVRVDECDDPPPCQPVDPVAARVAAMTDEDIHATTEAIAAQASFDTHVTQALRIVHPRNPRETS